MVEAQDLPEHVIQQIFLRMPIKPLVQLKCLSKHWNHVISDPSFMKLRSRRAILLPSLPFHAIDSQDQSMFKLFSSAIYQENYKHVTIVGSFNGIVLLVLTYRPHMILYNPLSGAFKTVPNPPSSSPHIFNIYMYGFGYATNEDDLKIVRIKDDFGGHLKCFEVFSLKTWSWSTPTKIIGDFSLLNTYSGTFANGFLYWNAGRATSFVQLIVALDMKTMVFSEIEIPNAYVVHCLGTYKGKLCMICSYLNVNRYELRVMTENAFEKSLLVCCFGSSFASQIYCSSTLGELSILDDGKLLMDEPGKLFIYDMLNDSYKEVNQLTGFRKLGLLNCVEYVESLIAPSDICSV